MRRLTDLRAIMVALVLTFRTLFASPVIVRLRDLPRSVRRLFYRNLLTAYGYQPIAGGATAVQGLVGPFMIAGAPVAAVNEVQTITPSAVMASGSFRVNFEGHRTPLLDFNISAADMQAALVALGSVGAAGVVVGLAGGPPQLYTCTFSGGNMAGRALPLMTIEENTCLDAALAAVTLTVAEGVAGVTASLRGAAPGAILIDTTNDDIYQNTGTALVPVWSSRIPAGVTSDAGEINLLDGSVAGTSVASKALALGANKNTDVLALPVSGLKIGAGAGTAVDCTAAELNTLNAVTAGTAAASKAVVLDANKRVKDLAVQHLVADKGADGAIAIAPGITKLSKGGVGAYTLADPAAGDEGVVMYLVATTAQAHTVDNSAGSGFNAGGAASDVATFGGAIGDNLVLAAIGAKWMVVSAKNVTLG